MNRQPINYATCASCSSLFVVRRRRLPDVPYCRAEACQREKNRKRLAAYFSTPRGQQARHRAQQRWRAKNGNDGWTEASKAAYQRRRARKAGGEVESFSNLEVFERDRWRCGICDGAVDQALSWPDPMSASIDHVIPISQSGPHTMANTRCAHLQCNVRRGARGSDQLRLLG